MRKVSSKNKALLIVALIILSFSVAYFGLGYPGRYRDSNKSLEEAKEPAVTEPDGTGDTQEKTKEEVKTENKVIDYQVTDLNKKDGDIFSIPDNVTFTISPSADKSKVTLTKDDGAVLYTGEGSGNEASFTIYPSGKLSEGTQGTLTIEGFKGSEMVVSKKIKVIF